MSTHFKDSLRAVIPPEQDFDNELFQSGGRILLPECTLNTVFQSGLPDLMIFSIFNRHHSLIVYAGVQSFVTEPGQCSLPYWMMEYLKIDYRAVVDVTLLTTQLPLATRAIFQPTNDDFFQVRDPKKLLESQLHEHPCLTQGTVLNILFNKKNYRLKVLKTEPEKVVSTHGADVICDFVTPLNCFDHSWYLKDSDLWIKTTSSWIYAKWNDSIRKPSTVKIYAR
jgi:hypothetical protein